MRAVIGYNLSNAAKVERIRERVQRMNRQIASSWNMQKRKESRIVCVLSFSTCNDDRSRYMLVSYRSFTSVVGCLK